MKISFITKTTLLLLFCILLGSTIQTITAKTGSVNISNETHQPIISFKPNQLVINAVIPMQYEAKSKIKLENNTLLANVYGLRVRVDGDKSLAKGKGSLNVKIDGMAPADLGNYVINIEVGKLKGEIEFAVVENASSPEVIENPDITDIKTLGSSFSKTKNIRMTVKRGSPSITLEYNQLLGSSNGIEIRYAGNINTYPAGEYTIPAIIKGGSNVTTDEYLVSLDQVEGIKGSHRIFLQATPAMNRVKCSNIRVRATGGKPFFEYHPIIIELNAKTTVTLTANQLLGSSNGIEIRYSGSQKTFYPGETPINVSISGGSAIEPGVYNIELDNLPQLTNSCNISVQVDPGSVSGKIKSPAIEVRAPADKVHYERRELTMTINTGSVLINDYTLIGFMPGIQVRYYGQSKVYSAGTHTINVTINIDGPTVGQGTYTIPLNLIAGVNPSGDLKVSVD